MRPNRVPSGQSQSADGHVEGQTKDRETRRAQMERCGNAAPVTGPQAGGRRIVGQGARMPSAPLSVKKGPKKYTHKNILTLPFFRRRKQSGANIGFGFYL